MVSLERWWARFKSIIPQSSNKIFIIGVEWKSQQRAQWRAQRILQGRSLARHYLPKKIRMIQAINISIFLLLEMINPSPKTAFWAMPIEHSSFPRTVSKQRHPLSAMQGDKDRITTHRSGIALQWVDVLLLFEYSPDLLVLGVIGVLYHHVPLNLLDLLFTRLRRAQSLKWKHCHRLSDSTVAASLPLGSSSPNSKPHSPINPQCTLALRWIEQLSLMEGLDRWSLSIAVVPGGDFEVVAFKPIPNLMQISRRKMNYPYDNQHLRDGLRENLRKPGSCFSRLAISISQ